MAPQLKLILWGKYVIFYPKVFAELEKLASGKTGRNSAFFAYLDQLKDFEIFFHFDF